MNDNISIIEIIKKYKRILENKIKKYITKKKLTKKNILIILAIIIVLFIVLNLNPEKKYNKKSSSGCTDADYKRNMCTEAGQKVYEERKRLGTIRWAN
jgi:hypothetical protein